MKIAIATENNHVSGHFGHCPEYTIVEVDGNNVKAKSVLPNPGHQPGFLPVYLSEQGVSHIIAGGMGPKAIDLFKQRNIVPIVGVQGAVDSVISSFLSGSLVSGRSMCDHGTEGHHGCGHGGCNH